MAKLQTLWSNQTFQALILVVSPLSVAYPQHLFTGRIQMCCDVLEVTFRLWTYKNMVLDIYIYMCIYIYIRIYIYMWLCLNLEPQNLVVHHHVPPWNQIAIWVCNIFFRQTHVSIWMGQYGENDNFKNTTHPFHIILHSFYHP